jgi:hypothetical protein
MNRTKVAIVLLVLALIGSNAWWATRLVDAGVTQTYMGVTLENQKQALTQTLTLLPLVARPGVTRTEILPPVRPERRMTRSQRTGSSGWDRSGSNSTHKPGWLRRPQTGVRVESRALSAGHQAHEPDRGRQEREVDHSAPACEHHGASSDSGRASTAMQQR